MKKQLIKLANEKGFESKYQYAIITDELNFYLWMCELQKWLMDNHFLHIYVVPYGENEGWILANIRNLQLDLLADKREIEAKKNSFFTYEQALEKGLIEALNLLK